MEIKEVQILFDRYYLLVLKSYDYLKLINMQKIQLYNILLKRCPLIGLASWRPVVRACVTGALEGETPSFNCKGILDSFVNAIKVNLR